MKIFILEIDIIVGVFRILEYLYFGIYRIFCIWFSLFVFFFKGTQYSFLLLFPAWKIIQNVEILGMQPFI